MDPVTTPTRAALLGFLESDQIRVRGESPLKGWTDTLAIEQRDYSDLIIAAVNKRIGCDFTYTLDTRAAKAVPGMELLA